MVEKILNNTTPYGKLWASHEGSLHSSTLTLSVFKFSVVNDYPFHPLSIKRKPCFLMRNYTRSCLVHHFHL